MGAWEGIGALVRACLGLLCDLSQDPPLLWASALPSGHRDGDEAASKALLALTACVRWEVSPEAAYRLGMEDADSSRPLNYMIRTMTTIHTQSSVLCSEPILFISSPGSLHHLGARIGKGPGQSCPPSYPQDPGQNLLAKMFK